jgi:hypothetical protein
MSISAVSVRPRCAAAASNATVIMAVAAPASQARPGQAKAKAKGAYPAPAKRPAERVTVGPARCRAIATQTTSPGALNSFNDKAAPACELAALSIDAVRPVMSRCRPAFVMSSSLA